MVRYEARQGLQVLDVDLDFCCWNINCLCTSKLIVCLQIPMVLVCLSFLTCRSLSTCNMTSSSSFLLRLVHVFLWMLIRCSSSSTTCSISLFLPFFFSVLASTKVSKSKRCLLHIGSLLERNCRFQIHQNSKKFETST